MKLVSRNLYCPIGTKSNVRMLPKTFVKVCLAHQEKQKESLKEKAHIAPGLFPCKSCPASEPIRQGFDPVGVVNDVAWISLDEYQSIQAKVTIIQEVMKKMEKVIDTIDVGANKRAIELISKVKECLISSETFISSAVSFLNQAEIELGVKKEGVIDLATFKWPELPPSKAGKSVIIYDLCVTKNITRNVIMTKYKISSNYISKLIGLYKKSNPVDESSTR